MGFLHLAGIHYSQVTTIVLLSFMEFLHSSGMSHANISNHMAGIRASMTIHGLQTDAFKDDRISLFIKAVKINAPLKPQLISVISIDLLQ